ncbi:MAG: GNAT family N-acetyltransferase [Thiotrichales bacterium]
MPLGIELIHRSGGEIAAYLDDLARLRIEVFREFPYLYDGSPAYEAKYLQTYLDSPDSIAMLALDGARVIGASTGLPLADETEAFQRPFVARGYAVERVFYCGESVLHRDYRGRGIYRHFFQGREDHARRLARFDYCSFCGVQRPGHHPLRPAGYQPLDAIWTRFGYTRHPELTTTFSWKDIDEATESDKPMLFWMKALA